MHRWTTTGTVAAALFLLSGCGDDADLMRGATPPSDDAPTAPPGGDVPIPSDDDAPSDQDPPRVPLGQPCALADGPDFCGEGFKCGLVQSSEFIDTDYVLRCVPEGRRSEGTACTTPVDDGQPDSCSAGLGCSFGACMASDADPGPRHPLLLPLVHGVLVGVGGAFSTADLFNLYVWFEVMLICALGLFALGGRRDQLDASFKYLVLNLIGTLLLLISVGAIYAATGHLNFGALAGAAPLLPPGLATVLLTALIVAFAIKAGAFPLYAWLPASYPTLPAPVLALFAGLLTKVGAYAVLRTVGDVFAPAPDVLLEALGWVACATMALKALVLFVLTRVFAIGGCDRWLFTLSLAQAGEFGFVLLSFTVANSVIPASVADLLLLVVALSMAPGSPDLLLFDGGSPESGDRAGLHHR